MHFAHRTGSATAPASRTHGIAIRLTTFTTSIRTRLGNHVKEIASDSPFREELTANARSAALLDDVHSTSKSVCQTHAVNLSRLRSVYHLSQRLQPRWILALRIVLAHEHPDERKRYRE